MSGASAADTLVEIRVKQLERGGKKLSEEEKKELFDSIKATYDEQTDPRYAAARLWVDAIIDPAKTREAMLTALEACALNPDVAKFNVGILQTLASCVTEVLETSQKTQGFDCRYLCALPAL